MSDDTADDGQGQGGLFDSYIDSVPESWDNTQGFSTPRDAVTSYLKDAERGVNSRLSEAAQLEKQFGAYKDVPLSNYDPQQLNDLLQWYDSVTSTEDGLKEWVAQVAQELGITQQQAEEQIESDQLTPEQLQALVQERTAPIEQQLSQFQEQQQLSSLERQIANDFSQLEQKTGRSFSDDEKSAIADLGEGHDGDGWISEGFKRYETLTGGAQANLVNSKLNQPKPSLSAGSQETPQVPKDIKQIEAMAVERLRQALNS